MQLGREKTEAECSRTDVYFKCLQKTTMFLEREKLDILNDMDFTWQARLFEMKPISIKK